MSDRASFEKQENGRFRVTVRGNLDGPEIGEKAARGIAAWLNAGGPDDIHETTGGIGKLASALHTADSFLDQIGGIFKRAE